MKAKTVTVEIFKYTNPERYEHGEILPLASFILHTNKPAGAPGITDGYLSQVIGFMQVSTGFTLEADDIVMLDSVWRHEQASFKFGQDWEFYVQIKVDIHKPKLIQANRLIQGDKFILEGVECEMVCDSYYPDPYGTEVVLLYRQSGNSTQEHRRIKGMTELEVI